MISPSIQSTPYQISLVCSECFFLNLFKISVESYPALCDKCLGIDSNAFANENKTICSLLHMDRSSLRILQHGLSIEELADNELPGKPKYIWTIKKDNLSEYDGYIVVSFEGNTLILEIGESVEEVSDTLLLNNVTTLHINILYDNSFIQVYDTGIRHINGKVVQEWVAPKNKQIKAASSNSSQIVISLSGGELIYFEIDESHTLVEIFRKNLNVEVLCLSIQQIPPNRVRANFLAVGCLDNVVRLLSIEKDKYFKQLSTHLLPNNSSPQDICISEMNDNGNTMKERNIIFLNIGLNTGVLLRSIIDRSF